MMADPEPQTIQKIKSGLKPYIRPREQVLYIRRVLALHLRSQCQTQSSLRPLSLLVPEASDPVSLPRGLQGPRREYLKAVQSNVKARKEYAAIHEAIHQAGGPGTSSQDLVDPIEEHISMVKLRHKHRRLSIIEKHVDLIVQQPAASGTFFSPEHLLENTPALPKVPPAIVNDLAGGFGSSKLNLAATLDQLEKVVLRTKLQLWKEGELLRRARAKALSNHREPSNRAKVHALSETRAELIDWIESELSIASGDDNDPATVGPSANIDDLNLNTVQQLSDIKKKYAAYSQARSSVLDLLSSRQSASGQPSLRPPRHEVSGELESVSPQSHLILPYLERLLELSRRQKGMIKHKSHLYNALSKKASEAHKMLEHLAEESQLLPRHRIPVTTRANSELGDHLTAATTTPSVQGLSRKWLFAGDSAKIATFEVVAETVEEGQIALEGSMKTLHGVDELLGRSPGGDVETQGGGGPTEDDLWLPEQKGAHAGTRSHMERRKLHQADQGDPWSAVDGNLGLIGQDSPGR